MVRIEDFNAPDLQGLLTGGDRDLLRGEPPIAVVNGYTRLRRVSTPFKDLKRVQTCRDRNGTLPACAIGQLSARSDVAGVSGVSD